MPQETLPTGRAAPLGRTNKTVADLGREIKTIHPEYNDMSDEEVGRRVKAKYPGHEHYADIAPERDYPDYRSIERSRSATPSRTPAPTVGAALPGASMPARVGPVQPPLVKTPPTAVTARREEVPTLRSPIGQELSGAEPITPSATATAPMEQAPTKMSAIGQALQYKPWIAVDLDNTLAADVHPEDKALNPNAIGPPNQEMASRVRQMLDQGQDVRIFTARAANDPHGLVAQAIQDWTEQYLGKRLPVTNQKDPGMREIWDDKAKIPPPVAPPMPTASQGGPSGTLEGVTPPEIHEAYVGPPSIVYKGGNLTPPPIEPETKGIRAEPALSDLTYYGKVIPGKPPVISDKPPGIVDTQPPMPHVKPGKLPGPPGEPVEATPGPATPKLPPAKGDKEVVKPTATQWETYGKPQSDIVYFIPHGDETTAKQVLHDRLKTDPAQALVSASGTRELKNNPGDPNKLFKNDNQLRKDIEKTLFDPSHKLIIALHNTYGDALSLEKTRSDAMSLKEPNYGGYILTTDRALYEELSKSQFNVILQATTTPQNDDGSASRRAAALGKRYVNVEAVRGDHNKQAKMLDAVLAAYRKLYPPQPPPQQQAQAQPQQSPVFRPQPRLQPQPQQPQMQNLMPRLLQR